MAFEDTALPASVANEIVRALGGIEASLSNMTTNQIPVMFRAVQQVAPPPSLQNIPGMNTLFPMLAPAIAQAAGIQNPMFLPQLAPGMDPTAGFFSAMVTTPAYNTFSQGMNQDYARRVGNLSEIIGNKFNINPDYLICPVDIFESIFDALLAQDQLLSYDPYKCPDPYDVPQEDGEE